MENGKEDMDALEKARAEVMICKNELVELGGIIIEACDDHDIKREQDRSLASSPARRLFDAEEAMSISNDKQPADMLEEFAKLQSIVVNQGAEARSQQLAIEDVQQRINAQGVTIAHLTAQCANNIASGALAHAEVKATAFIASASATLEEATENKHHAPIDLASSPSTNSQSCSLFFCW